MAGNKKGNAVAAAAVVAAPAPAAFPSNGDMIAQGMTTLSARIRHLAGMGMSTGDISRNVLRDNGQPPKYQHVRNVLRTPLKRAIVETETANANS